MDEPTAGVDPVARARIIQVIKKYNKKRAMILTTHLMEETEALCDDIGIMVNGDFVAYGSPQDLINRHASGYQIEISLNRISYDKVSNLCDYIESHFRDPVLTERDTLVVAYQIPNKNKLSTVFKAGDFLSEQLGVTYVVSE